MDNLSTDHAERMLDAIDALSGRALDSAKRRSPRRNWRKRLRVKLTQPGGDQRTSEIVTRNLSRGGLTFLNIGFLHSGTRCDLQLTTAEGAWIEVSAVVVRCRFIAGRFHEVSIRFDEPIDDSQLITQRIQANILVVDDAEDTLRLTAHHLHCAGAKVTTTHRGDQAIELASKYDYDLVLLDIEMPKIDGLTVARTLRERGITIPLVAYTAAEDEVTHEKCLTAGCVRVLVKPVSRADLIKVVTTFLTVRGPIESTEAGNQEMADFIHEFVTTMPDRIESMQACIRTQDVGRLKAIAAKLRVAASESGGCGFGEVSTAARVLEKELTEAPDWVLTQGVLDSLMDLSERVQDVVE